MLQLLSVFLVLSEAGKVVMQAFPSGIGSIWESLKTLVADTPTIRDATNTSFPIIFLLFQ